ncbi:MAG TPA: triple tyrosine motif-containing protein, partial [Candidatus Polarisedimenticolia bacterium]|nr:triple tyrosine motif-containing protein [Candidatus Polarisedimenticolia bacterium]
FYQKDFTTLDLGLAGPVVVASDPQGGAWVGSQSSPLYHLAAENPGSIGPQDPGWVAVGKDNWGDWAVGAMYRAPDGTLWIASDGLFHETLTHGAAPPWASKGKKTRALRERTGHDWVEIEIPPELADKKSYLQAMTQDRAGGLWVSFGGAGLWRFADQTWTPAGGRKELPGNVICEHTDGLGRVWFGCTRNRVAVLDGNQVRVFGPDDGLRVGNVLAFAGRGPDLWVAGEFGLQRFSDGGFRNIQPAGEDLLMGISGLVERANGDLWINGLSGIVRIDHTEVAAALADAGHRVTGLRWGVRDGLPGFAAQIRPLPSLVEGTDGRLWFAVNWGCVVLDPERAVRQVPGLTVTIQSVSADDVPFDLHGGLRFPAGTSMVQIAFMGVSLSAPEAVRYRYRLQGIDRDWRETRSRAPISWRNLAPGSYRFTVEASDTSGAWRGNRATAEFTLLPAFYQTTWFALLGVAAALAAISLLFLLRLRQATRRVRMQLEARLGERERIARELHDTLLQSVQGLILKFQGAANDIPPEAPSRKAIERTLDHADRVVAEGRSRVRTLRGGTLILDDLTAALQRAADEGLGAGRAPIRTTVQGHAREIHPMVLEEVYEIGREALANALVHSGASRIDVEIGYEPAQFRLRVKDDGGGIDAAILEKGRENHFGLQGMRERARRIGAQLDLSSRPGGGTEVTLTVPAATAYRALEEARDSWLRRLTRRSSRQPSQATREPASPQ